MRVAYQGEPGAFSEEAGNGYFCKPEMVPQKSFDDVFSAVASSDCQSGFIPIENSLAGSIHQNYDLLLRHSLFIVGEYLLRVQHCLIGFRGTNISDITHVTSHPQALGQCAGFIRKNGFTPEPAYDTAGSLRILKSSGEKNTAAIASRIAAGIYQMEILQEGIEDNPENYTRFLEISRQSVKPEGEAKTSIVITLKNQPGALYKALAVLALRDIDLTKIESRPLIGKPWDYLFYIDFVGDQNNPTVKKALEHLQENALMLRNLGSYPRYKAVRKTSKVNSTKLEK